MFKKILIILMVTALFAPAIAKEKAGEVLKAKGRVEIVHGNAVMGKRAKAGSELIIKDIVRTKRRGFAEVGFVDGTAVKVFEKSRLTLNGIERTTDGYNAEIQKGKVLFKVEKMHDVAGDFRVKTTNSIIGVKGTTFGIVSGSLVTIVEVFNGQVEVKATIDLENATEADLTAAAEAVAADKGGDKEENKATLAAALSEGTVTLNAGEGLRIDAAGTVEVFEISADNTAFAAAPAEQGGQDDQQDADDQGDDGDQGGQQDDGAGDQNGDQQDDGADTPPESQADDGDAGDTPPAPPTDDEQAYGTRGVEEEQQAVEVVEIKVEELEEKIQDIVEQIETQATEIKTEADELEGVQQQQQEQVEEQLEQVQEQVDDANEIYDNPDERPETEEQIEQSTGTVNINITFQ
jgi:hypothetical protein